MSVKALCRRSRAVGISHVAGLAAVATARADDRPDTTMQQIVNSGVFEPRRERGYSSAARDLGAGCERGFLRHILPNMALLLTPPGNMSGCGREDPQTALGYGSHPMLTWS
jgi:hypothetical protein